MSEAETLRERIAELEADARGGHCICRSGQITRYHTSRELARIMAVACPVHHVRDVPLVMWVPAGAPLLPEDRRLCTCPPSPARAWREGLRGPLTAEEQEAEFERWAIQLDQETMEKVRREQIQARRLLHSHLQRVRRAHGNSRAMSRQNERR